MSVQYNPYDSTGTPYSELDQNQNQNTYGVQAELALFHQQQKEHKKVTLLRNAEQDLLLDDKDPLVHNNLEAKNQVTADERSVEAIDPRRFYKETRTILNINSRARCSTTVSSTPPESNIEQEPVLNSSFGPPRVKSEEIPLNHYRFHLERSLHNIKSVRLLSTELPRTLLSSVTAENNLIQVGLIVKQAQQWLPIEYIERYTLPYLLVTIPPGHYQATDLIETIESILNELVAKYTEAHYQSLFSLLYDPETDAIQINCHQPNVRFSFCFCPHPRYEQLSLYYMLGFATASTKKITQSESELCSSVSTDSDSNSDSDDELAHPLINLGDYVAQWSNLVVSEPIHHLCRCRLKQKRPYRPVNLNPHSYIYLAIRGLPTITDPLIHGYDLFAKVLIDRLINQPLLPVSNFIHNTKFLLEPLRELTDLYIDWIDAYGQPVDFQHQEHSLTIELVEYVDRLVDAYFSSTRGAHDQTSFTLSSARL